MPGIPTRPFGRHGEQVPALGVGVWIEEERDHVEAIRAAIDAGAGFLDTAWDYHGGRSEERLACALEHGYRDRAFVMTEVDARTHRAARDQIRESLARLDVDRVDLLQFHEIIRPWEPEVVFDAEDGAILAVVEAVAAGLVRYVGFTGHKDPSVMLKMLSVAEERGFEFDSCQLPLNCFDPHYRSFETHLLPKLLAAGVAPLGMKPLGGGHLLRAGVAGKAECLRYTLSLPVAVCITGINALEHLDEALDAARSFTPMIPEETRELLERTSRYGAEGAYEHYKTTVEFDGTARNPEWLGVGPKATSRL